MSERPIIALLYDFDKTLCTTDMEDYTFIPSLGYTPAEFWQKANNFGWENQMDGLLAYMYTMIEECRAQGKTLNRDYLVQCGKAIELFPGVREWFGRINAFGDSLGVTVEHPETAQAAAPAADAIQQDIMQHMEDVLTVDTAPIADTPVTRDVPDGSAIPHDFDRSLETLQFGRNYIVKE